MAPSFEYDESGVTFSYFIISIATFFLLPFTYYILYHHILVTVKSSPKFTCNCLPCRRKNEKITLKNRQKSRKIIITFILVVIWLLFMYTAKRIHSVKIKSKVPRFDPFQILGVDESASLSEIKAVYRKIVLTKHPDHGGDLEEYMVISKAYRALSDPQARENYVKYGNPDGPSDTAVGIALPSWLISKQYSRFVFLIYFICLIVGLPAILAFWWYRSKKYYLNKLLSSTTQLYCHFLRSTPELSWRKIFSILSASEELSTRCSSFMKITFTQSQDVHSLVVKQGIKPEKEAFFNQPYCVKARALLYAHLSRVAVPSSLKADTDEFLVKFLLLLGEFQNLMSSFIYYKMIGESQYGPSFDTYRSCLKLSSLVVQGLRISDSPVLQLPHFTEDILISLQRKKKTFHSIESLFSLSERDKSQLYSKFTKDELFDIFEAIRAMPFLNLKVDFQVDDDLSPSTIEMLSLVTVIITIERSSLIEKCDNLVPLFNQASSNSQTTVDASVGSQEAVEHSNSSPETTSPSDLPLFYVHAPTFPYEKKEGWWAYIVDSTNKLRCSPLYFHLSKPVQSVKLYIFAPDTTGLAKYTCHIVSDSYLDLEYRRDITFTVSDPPEIVESHPQWECISEEEGANIDSDVLTDSEEPQFNDSSNHITG